MTYTDEAQRLLHWRSIQPGHQCDVCGGSGNRLYGSTATWHGGIGGQAMTLAVCDHCWGSGDKTRHWTDLRKLEQQLLALQPPTEKTAEQEFTAQFEGYNAFKAARELYRAMQPQGGMQVGMSEIRLPASVIMNLLSRWRKKP